MATLPTETITHNGEEFTISFEQWLTCGDCGENWETHRDPGPDGQPAEGGNTCPHCGATTGHTYEKRVHYYTKFATIPLEDPPLDAQVHADAVHNFADKLEALAANGWEMTESDGVHIYFEKTVTESTESPHKVTDDLE